MNVTVNPTLTSIAVSPAATTVAPNGTQPFTATARDQFGTNLAAQPTFTWSVISGGGIVDSNGLYTAPATAGSATVRAAAGSVSGTASVAVVIPRPWWKLDESSGTTASDSSGNANHGTTVNGPSWVGGKFGNALSFDGVDDHVTLPNSIASSAAGSVSMWVKTAAHFADSAMLFYTSPVTIGNGGGAENELHLNFLNDERIQFFIEGGAADVSVTSASSYADNAWHHVAATWDINGNAVLYVDGARSAPSCTTPPASRARHAPTSAVPPRVFATTPDRWTTCGSTMWPSARRRCRPCTPRCRPDRSRDSHSTTRTATALFTRRRHARQRCHGLPRFR